MYVTHNKVFRKIEKLIMVISRDQLIKYSAIHETTLHVF